MYTSGVRAVLLTYEKNVLHCVQLFLLWHNTYTNVSIYRD